MKKISLLLLFVALYFTGFSQNYLITDDFESYNVGDYVAENSDVWTTWSNNPGSAEDAVISDDTAFSGTKSMMVSGTNDMVLPFGDKTSGKYQINFKYFVPTGFAGYYNLQHFETPGTEWACEVYFANDGSGYIQVNSVQTPFTFPMNTWFAVENYVNIDADSASLTINGVHILSWQFSMQADEPTGTNQLGGMNMYAGAPTGQTPKYYVDDVVFYPVPELLFADNFDSYTLGDYVAENSDVWTTWSNNPGSAEDAVISDDTAFSMPYSMMVSGTNDMVLPFGNKTSGEYQINFEYFVPTGFGGYYNLQHFEAPGNEWACEVYFANDGTGYISVNSVQTPFTYPINDWFHINNYVNIDADSASLTIDGVHILSWQFSMQSNAAAGTNQLGGMNMFAGSPTGQTPKYYVDDVEFWSLSTELLPPTVSVDVTNIVSTGQDGTFHIENVGQQDLAYSAYPLYPEGVVTKINSGNASSMSYMDGTKDAIMTHVTSALTSGVGYSSTTDVRAAAWFKPEKVGDYAGMYLTSVDLGFWELPTGNTAQLMVWDRGSYTTPGPGVLLDTVSFAVSTVETVYTVNLHTPIYLEGKDIWVGYMCNNTGGTFPIGVDAGPREFQSSWLSVGPGWSEMNPATDANIYVSCNLTGDAAAHWMSITPESGIVTPGGEETVTVSFDTVGLVVDSTYTGQIIVASNDASNEYVTIDVDLTVVSGINEVSKIGVMTYPNPASDYVNIISNSNIEMVQIINVTGQVVYQTKVNAPHTKVQINNLEQGTYILNVKIDGQMVSKKISIN